MMSENRGEREGYHELAQFFGAYLNQDYKEIYGDIDGAIETFVRETTLARRDVVAGQLRRLLEEFGDDSNLRTRALYYGLEVNGGASKGISRRAWLTEVAERLAS